MASIDKVQLKVWLDQQPVETLEDVFLATFLAMEQLNAGEKMNIGNGQLEVKFDHGAFWNGVNQRSLYVRAYLLIDPSHETSDKPLWANIVNQVPEIPTSQFTNFFKTL